MGDLTEGKANNELDVKLEPAWRKLTSSRHNTGHVKSGTRGWTKKELNPLGSNGKILLCYSCGSYRHLVAECEDSWENMVKRKVRESNVKSRDQFEKDKLKDKENRSMEPLEHGEICGEPVTHKQLEGEMTQLKIEIRNLKAEIKEIKAVKDIELIRQKEDLLCHEKRNVLEENDIEHKESGTTLQEQFQSMMKLQGDLSRAIKEMKEKLSTKDSLSRNNQCDSEIKEKEIDIWRDMEQNGERIKLLGTDYYAKQDNKKVTRTERSTSSEGIHQDNGTKKRLLEKAKKVRQKLQITSLISQMKQKLDTDKTNQVRQWFWWPVERQHLNEMVLQVIAGIWVS